MLRAVFWGVGMGLFKQGVSDTKRYTSTVGCIFQVRLKKGRGEERRGEEKREKKRGSATWSDKSTACKRTPTSAMQSASALSVPANTAAGTVPMASPSIMCTRSSRNDINSD